MQLENDRGGRRGGGGGKEGGYDEGAIAYNVRNRASASSCAECIQSSLTCISWFLSAAFTFSQ